MGIIMRMILHGAAVHAFHALLLLLLLLCAATATGTGQGHHRRPAASIRKSRHISLTFSLHARNFDIGYVMGVFDCSVSVVVVLVVVGKKFKIEA